MIEAWKDFGIRHSAHSLIRLQQRGISKEEIDACFKEPGKFVFCKEGKEKGLWEAFFKRSHKYQLKIVVSEDKGRKELKVITAYIINKERAKKAQLWIRQQR